MLNRYLIRCSVLCVMVLFHYVNLGAQSKINKTATLRSANDIKSSTGYNFKIVEGEITKDSFISVIRLFNSKGYRTETSIYEEGKLKSKYEFDYLSDTLLTAQRFYVISDDHLTLISQQEFEYNKRNLLVKVFDSHTVKKYKGTQKNKYNKKGQLTKETLKFGRRKVKDNRYEYGKNGMISKKVELAPTKETFVYKYDENDNLYQVHKIYKDGSKKLTKHFDYNFEDNVTTRQILNTTSSILGINGRTKLWRTDVLTTINTFDEYCQIKAEKEYLNGELNGFRKFYHNL